MSFRVVASLAVFLVCMGCGFLPLSVRSNRRVLSLANSFAGGIFLAGGLVHLLSEAAASFSEGAEGGEDVLLSENNNNAAGIVIAAGIASLASISSSNFVASHTELLGKEVGGREKSGSSNNNNNNNNHLLHQHHDPNNPLAQKAHRFHEEHQQLDHHHHHHDEENNNNNNNNNNNGEHKKHDHHHHGHNHSHGSTAYILCACGFMLTFFVEKVVMMRDVKAENDKEEGTEMDTTDEESHLNHHGHSHGTDVLLHGHSHGADVLLRVSSKNSVLLPYVLTLVLALHSVIAGLALGIQEDSSKAFLIFLAIISHKWIEAFALGISIVRSNAPFATHFRLVSMFSLTTPLGVLLGSILEFVVEGERQNTVASGLSALASGTFIYVAIVDTLIDEFAVAKDKYYKFLLVIVGFTAMVLLSSYFDVHQQKK